MDPRARDPRLAGRGTAVAAPASGARLAPGSGAGSSGSGPVGAGAGTSGGVPSLAQRKDFGVALVCACNMNRSMSAHKLLMENGFEKVASYGTARCVKLPGGPSGVRTFDFGQPYSLMEADLRTADARALKWMNDRKIFGMLTRNQGIKKAPEHWREEKSPQRFDLIICFEQRVFDSLVEDVQSREPGSFQPVHVVNLEIKDTIETAVVGAKVALQLSLLCAALGAERLVTDMDKILEKIRPQCPTSDPQYFLHFL